jgi:radical SAM superfamily enzyme YgiQ (UPF0313 family)
LPLPRIDLLKTDRYMFGSMPNLRGCPFTCEFCDPPFGRRPGLKTSAQVPAELEAFARAGLTHAIPATPLYDRLRQAGRPNDDDASDRYGTNVVPLRMSRE